MAADDASCQWMWADAGFLGRSITGSNPLRWSKKMTRDALLQDLNSQRNLLRGTTGTRPLTVIIGDKKVDFASVTVAINGIGLVPKGASMRRASSQDLAASFLPQGVVACSDSLELTNGGCAVKKRDEPTGEDHHLVVYDTVRGELARKWRVTARWNQRGARGAGAEFKDGSTSAMGITTSAVMLTTKAKLSARPGVLIEFCRSGSVRYHVEGVQKDERTGPEIKDGDTIELALDATAGVFTLSKDGAVFAQYDHSADTPICDLTWYPYIALDDVDETAAVAFDLTVPSKAATPEPAPAPKEATPKASPETAVDMTPAPKPAAAAAQPLQPSPIHRPEIKLEAAPGHGGWNPALDKADEALDMWLWQQQFG